jgi:hypothetical protein
MAVCQAVWLSARASSPASPYGVGERLAVLLWRCDVPRRFGVWAPDSIFVSGSSPPSCRARWPRCLPTVSLALARRRSASHSHGTASKMEFTFCKLIDLLAGN